MIWRPKHHGANTPTCSACPYPLHSNANSCWAKFCAKDLIIEVGLEKSDVNAKMLSAGMAAACKSFKSMANHNTSSYDTINRLHWTNMAGKNRAQSWVGNLKEKISPNMRWNDDRALVYHHTNISMRPSSKKTHLSGVSIHRFFCFWYWFFVHSAKCQKKINNVKYFIWHCLLFCHKFNHAHFRGSATKYKMTPRMFKDLLMPCWNLHGVFPKLNYRI